MDRQAPVHPPPGRLHPQHGHLTGHLGGLRVVLIKLNLAIVHACLAQAFFCLTALVAAVTSRWWGDRTPATQHSPAAYKSLAGLAVIATAVIYLQLIAGAVMRHYQAGLAIPDFPLAYGQLVPPTSDHALAAANDFRVWKLNMDTVSMAQVWIHFAHRLGAVVVTLLVGAVVAKTLLRHRGQRR